MAKGLLVAAFDFSPAHADEFHDWYDHEHLPERQRVPGFGACERWIGVEGPAIAVATYDLEHWSRCCAVRPIRRSPTKTCRPGRSV